MNRDFFEKFGFSYKPDFDGYFKKAEKQFEIHGNKILCVEDDTVFGIYRDEINSYAEQLKLDDDNSIYAYLLAELITFGNDSLVYAISKPYAEKKMAMYDTLPLFSLVWCLPDMIKEHKLRNLPESVTRDTIGMIENQIGDFVVLNGRVGISSYVNWMMSFIKCRIIRVGRFNFEMCKFANKYAVLQKGETYVVVSDGESYHSCGRVLGSVGCENEDNSFKGEFSETNDYFEGCICDGEYCDQKNQRFYKSDGWKLSLKQGDSIVSVHIPTGGPLNVESCNNDFKYGADVITHSFGDFKAFYCSSWLLDPQLKRIIGKETNLTRFADRFVRFPVKSTGNDVFEYVFNLSGSVPPQELKESSSLSKLLKNHLASGGHIYGAAGIFFERE